MKKDILKNWTVVCRPVQGLDGMLNRERYLMSKPRHRHSKIVSVLGDSATSKRIIVKGENYLLKQRIERKGGRPISSFAVELSLSLPPTVEPKPTPEQWKKIAINCAKAIANYLGLSPEEKQEFFAHVRCVLHDQRNPHVHLILCKVINNRILHDLQRKQCIKVAKASFTASVYKVCDIAIRDYKPYEVGRGKRVDKWQYERLKSEEANNLAKNTIKLQRQIDKWMQAYEENNVPQMNRQFNRIGKSSKAISHDMPSDLTQVLKKVESLAGKTIA